MTFSGHIARKRFGQHWLKDELVLEKILNSAKIQRQDRVLEVGPGRGALTEKLLASDASVIHTVELDRKLAQGLKERFANESRFTLQEGDVLSTSLVPPDGRPVNKVVANIPYNITGPLLGRLVGCLDRPAETTYKLLVLLIQKEVADRITASPGQSSFSALSVRLQLLARCWRVCSVHPSSFKPSPKVHSEVIVLEPFSPEERLDFAVARQVEVLLRTAFKARRKMLRNTLVELKNFDDLNELADSVGIELSQRPQEVSPNSWVDLAKGLNRMTN